MRFYLLQTLFHLNLLSQSAQSVQDDTNKGFAMLKPAFTMRLDEYPIIRIGKGFSNATTGSGPIRNGTVISVPGYTSETLLGDVLHGNDIWHLEADARSASLQFMAVIQPPEGEAVAFTFTGYITGNNETLPLFEGSPDAESTNYGSAFMEAKFETSNPKWDIVNRKVFVGSQRLLLEPGKPMVALIHWSEVYWSEDEVQAKDEI